MTTVCVFKDRIYSDMLVTVKRPGESEREVSPTRITKIKLLPRPRHFKSGLTIVGGLGAGALSGFEMYMAYLSKTISLFEDEDHLIEFFAGLNALNKLCSRKTTFVIFGYNKDKEIVSFHPSDISFTTEEFVLGTGSISLSRYLDANTMDLIKDPLVSFGARVLLDDSSGTDYHMWDPKEPNKLQTFSLKDDKKVIEKIKKVLVNKMEIGL